ncbi:(2Fe-2S)-binding protein [Chelativorans sp. J32]|jgi:NADH dehydrogenase/NADH:ubiquinone oxidoreductase 75 kD subunit (chain G)|uniref:(2Fe-2S)-binding protein n=1 Tax=Chelativorans sp. J32 TaxID=935840 RepID=UPI00048768C2|nr:(2Fe-2S)-binding protein [Chelativorans sp. J32]
MFKRIATSRKARLSFDFEGHRLEAEDGDTVAAALLLAGERVLRSTAVSASERGPFCLMGVCFECLVEIDGIPNRQACMVKVLPDMRVRRQRGAARVGSI